MNELIFWTLIVIGGAFCYFFIGLLCNTFRRRISNDFRHMPWVFVAFEAAFTAELLNCGLMTKLLYKLDIIKIAVDWEYFKLAIAVLMAVVLLIYLLRRRRHLLLNLRNDFLRLFLDPIFLLTFSMHLSEYDIVNDYSFDGPGMSGSSPQITYVPYARAVQGGVSASTGTSAAYTSQGESGEFSNAADFGGAQSVPEKYADQHRVRESGDSYSTVEIGGQSYNYSGEYVPFASEGDVGDISHYDSDEAPMK